MVGRLLHLWLNFITFMVGITFMVVNTFMGDTPPKGQITSLGRLMPNCASLPSVSIFVVYSHFVGK